MSPTTEPISKFRPRQLGAVFFVVLGLMTLCSALLINPLISSLARGPAYIDFADVQLSYFIWASLVGLAFLFVASRIAKGPSWADSVALLLMIIGPALLSDRYLLSRMGLPLWTFDEELHYKHRPGITRSLASYGRPNDQIKINAWGHHDSEFPLAKDPDETRILVLGDSITMGYGVTYAETFSAQLENLLGARYNDRQFQVINSGVHGYSTAQERIVLERSLTFDPDMIILGFCMNDVTEPFVVDTRLGGTGLDYHGVWQATSSLGGWVANETGYGRLVQRLAERGKSLEAAKRTEVYSVRNMAASAEDDPTFAEPWQNVLDELTTIYTIAKTQEIPVILVIFPFDFQLLDPTFMQPQLHLSKHATLNGVPTLDVSESLRSQIFKDQELVEYLRKRDKSWDQILGFHRSIADTFYFDDNHFTRQGHAVIAQDIFALIEREPSLLLLPDIQDTLAD